MAKFEINTSKCKNYLSDLGSTEKELKNIKSDVDKVLNILNQIEFKYVNLHLKNASQSIGTIQSSITNLKTSFESIIATYQSTESQIIGVDLNAEKIFDEQSNGTITPNSFKTMQQLLNYVYNNRNNLSAALLAYLLSLLNNFLFGNQDERGYYLNSIVFDSEGSYGGNQGKMNDTYKWDPIKCWELLSQLKEYYPDMNLFKAYSYFARIDNSGCGYVAIANTLFLEYEGREREFEKTFGFPMYKDNDLNYDRLILDIWARTDIAGINDDSDGMPDGITVENIPLTIERYMDEKGLSASAYICETISKNEFRDISESGGKVIIAYFAGDIYDVNGKAHHINNGHGMTVTGITRDGRYVVSSWGKKYYISSEDIGPDDSFVVTSYNT